MIKRTLFFGNPAYLSTKNEQLVVNFPEEDKKQTAIPIEDLGFVVLENPQITLTNGLLMKLVQNKTAVITCDKQHLPCSFVQPLVGHTEQTERIRHQLNASYYTIKKGAEPYGSIVSKFNALVDQYQALLAARKPAIT